MSLPCNVVRKCVGCSGVHMRPDADPCGRALWRFLWSSGRGVAMSGPRSGRITDRRLAGGPWPARSPPTGGSGRGAPAGLEAGIAGMDPGRYRVLLSVIHIRIIKRNGLIRSLIRYGLIRYTQSSIVPLHRTPITVFLTRFHLPSVP